MRDEGREYWIAGAFVVGTAALLLAWLALLSGHGGATTAYHVRYGRVAGLRPGTEVTFDGYPVGRVEAIRPEDGAAPRRFRVELRLRRDWPVPEDSRARVVQGLFARVSIDIAGGRSAQRVAPGGEIRGEEADELFAQAGSLVARVSSLLAALQPLVEQSSREAPAILASVGAAAADLERSSQQLASLLSSENVERAERTVAGLESASGGAAALAARLDATGARLDALLERVAALLAEDGGEVSVAARDLEHSLAAIARHVDAIAGDLETSSRNLAEFTGQLRADPSALVRGRERGEPEAAP